MNNDDSRMLLSGFRADTRMNTNTTSYVYGGDLTFISKNKDDL